MADISQDEQNHILSHAIQERDTTLLQIALEQPNSITLSNELGFSTELIESATPELFSILAENIKVQDYRNLVFKFNSCTPKEKEFIRLLIERFGVVDFSTLTREEYDFFKQSIKAKTNRTTRPIDTQLESTRKTRMVDYTTNKPNITPDDHVLGSAFLSLLNSIYRFSTTSRLEVFQDRYNWIQTLMYKKAICICKAAALCFTRKHLLQDEHLFHLIFQRVLNTTYRSHWEEQYSIMVKQLWETDFSL